MPQIIRVSHNEDEARELLSAARRVAEELAVDGVPFGIAFTEAARLLAGTQLLAPDPAGPPAFMPSLAGLKGIGS